MIGSFYKSREWEKLIALLRVQRVNENGDVICAHCGKPIVRAYDCIGHHVIELDESNVNDASVSLNPDNIVLVHHRCHNKIHKKLYTGESVRQVFLVYGSPLSGKTSWVRSVRCDGDLIVDMDDIWQFISGCERYTKPAVLNSIAFGVRDYLIESVRYRRGKWRNAYVIGGYPLIGERERLTTMLDAREVFIDTPKQECIDRLFTCDDRDPKTWMKYIEDWWRMYSPPTLTQ